MTENELQQLSKDVAKKYGISCNAWYERGRELSEVWLHQDSARCFDLMVEHGVYSRCIGGDYAISEIGRKLSQCRAENYNNDKHLATRVSILKALLAKD